MKTVVIRTLKEGEAWVKGFLPQIKRPAVILLDGDLGAGKTQFSRWFMHALGAEATSPTFAIHQRYRGRDGWDIDHVDLYRLKSDADLESSGFWDLFEQKDALLFVEWADRLPADVWPQTWQRIFIKLKNEGGERRSLSFAVRPHGS